MDPGQANLKNGTLHVLTGNFEETAKITDDFVADA
jgi:hypothetical protein